MAFNQRKFQRFANVILTVLCMMSVMPFILLVSSSITQEAVINQSGYSFFPRQIDFAAYQYLFMAGKSILRAYGMTLAVTAAGTTGNIFLTMSLGYLLSKKDLVGRNVISFFVFFTMLFSGGMVPSYIIWSQVFKVSNTVWGLICPNLMLSAFNVILMRTYFSTNIPSEIKEAAEMDAASQVDILFRIAVPLSKPMIATVGLFSALGYWNDWINGLYYLTRKKELYTIQNVLNSMASSVQFLKDNVNASIGLQFSKGIPTLGVRMAIAVIAVIPVLVIYPFFQKFFIRGIVIGGVKG
ncbi:MAG: carbohydrate ABC transporter permease [Lachnospiraceae bacterium]|nr:carbohydrate ABC transporter permease [Lachnospiraceae bacterium]